METSRSHKDRPPPSRPGNLENHPAGEAPWALGVLAMQRLAGNAAVTAAMRDPVVQRKVFGSAGELWSDVLPSDPGYPARVAAKDSRLKKSYDDSMSNLGQTSFQQIPKAKAGAETGRTPADQLAAYDNKPYFINYQPQPQTTGRWSDAKMYGAMMVHELGHVGTSAGFHLDRHFTAADLQGGTVWSEIDIADGAADDNEAIDRVLAQEDRLRDNVDALKNIVEKEKKTLGTAMYSYLTESGDEGTARLDYMLTGGMGAHYETVLTEMMITLQGAKKSGTRTYKFMSRMLGEAVDRRRNDRRKVAKVDPKAWWFQFWKW